MREIVVVYQDCVLCGVKGRAKIAEMAQNGIHLRKVGFSTEEGKDLIREAVLYRGIKTMPFYVEGDKYTSSLKELLAEPKKVVKATKKTKKAKNIKKRSQKDGDDSEA